LNERRLNERRLTGLWRATLRERVARRCGDPRERFAGYGHLFGEWVDGRSVPPDVEDGIAAYLGAAARVGRARGTAIGVLLGAGGALLAVLAIWLLS
jgi:hypothetical protein